MESQRASAAALAVCSREETPEAVQPLSPAQSRAPLSAAIGRLQWRRGASGCRCWPPPSGAGAAAASASCPRRLLARPAPARAAAARAAAAAAAMRELTADPRSPQPLSQPRQTQGVRTGCLGAFSSDHSPNIHPDQLPGAQAVPSWVLGPRQRPRLSPAPAQPSPAPLRSSLHNTSLLLPRPRVQL